ncbi:MAG: hypothetical protein BJ554DRAFT_697, partial [Olpidium bornovanus]
PLAETRIPQPRCDSHNSHAPVRHPHCAVLFSAALLLRSPSVTSWWHRVTCENFNNNYTLALPPRLRQVHPVFHVSLFRPYNDPGEKRKVNRPRENEKGEYEVERIIGMRTRHSKRQFLVFWLGYDRSEATWENEQELVNAQEAVVVEYGYEPNATLLTIGAFSAQQPRAAAPLRSRAFSAQQPHAAAHFRNRRAPRN